MVAYTKYPLQYRTCTLLNVFNLAADVKFKEVNCSVDESVGSVKHTLVLNKPLSADATIEVMTVNQSTHSELHTMQLYII